MGNKKIVITGTVNTCRTITVVWESDCYDVTSYYELYLNGHKTETVGKGLYGNLKTCCTFKELKAAELYKIMVRAVDECGNIIAESEERHISTRQLGASLNIAEYGAVGDGKKNNFAAIQRAIDDCPEDGAVVIPKGTFLTSPIYLKSKMTLMVEAGGKIIGSRNKSDYQVMESRWEGLTFPSYASLITVKDAHSVVIMGEGTIDGNAGMGDDGLNLWWDKPKAYNPATEVARPRLIHIVDSEDIILQGVEIRNSPSWTIHPLYSKNLHFVDLKVYNPDNSPNTDGLNPDSSEDMDIINVKFDVGDDCIAIKSGKDEEGRKIARPSRNILVSNCIMYRGHGGVTIGSEMSGGINNVYVKNCVFDGTDIGVRLKTLRGRGGCIKDVFFDGIIMKNIVMAAFNINSDYDLNGEPLPAGEVTETTPVIKSLYLHNIYASGAKEASYFKGLREMPVQNIYISNVEVYAEKGLYINDVEQVEFSNVRIFTEDGKYFRDGSRVQAVFME